MNNSKVSIIIPVYNTGKYLFKCLDSMINQTYSNLEIIIIDDGSNDESPKICDDYALKDNRIKVIHKENAGVSKARNAGIEIATGDYFYFPDSDDYIESNTIELLIELVKENDVDIINFEYYVTYSHRENVHLVDKSKYGLFNVEKSHEIFIEDEPFAWNKFFSKRIIENVLFREDILRGEDSLFSHIALENTEKALFIETPLYHYVQSEESACRGKFRKSQLTAMKLFDAYKPIYLEKYPNLWYKFLVRMLGLIISLYFDMWNDEEDFDIEMKQIYSTFKVVLSKNKSKLELSKKNKVKYILFRICPKFFCLIHKKTNKL